MKIRNRNVRSILFFGCAAALLPACGFPAGSFAQRDPGRLPHDRTQAHPPVVDPGTASTQNQPGRPPSDAIVLFDGKDLSRWASMNGSPTKWVVRDGYMECVAGSGYIRTLQNFGDSQFHLEWMSPAPPKGDGQGRGNSGVFFGMDRYEIQILDSYNNRTYADGSAAAVYGQYPPLANAARPPGEWQSYDILYTAPRFDDSGKLVSPARFTVFHNGVLVHQDVELTGPTAWLGRPAYQAHPEKLPIALQDHGNPVRFRNIWLRELGSPGRDEYTLPTALLDSYAGTYEVPRGTRVTVTREGNQLTATLYGTRFVLFAESPAKFFAKTTDVEFEFVRSAEGAVEALVFSVGEGATRAVKVP